MNWVTREDTSSTNRSRAEVTPVIIKSANLKGAIRNRKVQKKAHKRRPQYHSSSHTQKKNKRGGGGSKGQAFPSRLTPVGGVSEVKKKSLILTHDILRGKRKKQASPKKKSTKES